MVVWNIGIVSVDVKYICCLDVDDVLELEFVSCCVWELEWDNSLGLVYIKICYVLLSGKIGVSLWFGEWDFDC